MQQGSQHGSGNVQHNHFTGGPPVTWPRRIGVIPPLAAGRVEREADTSDAAGCLILRGLGGVGKTQLAAGLAHRAEADLVMWATAASREQIVSAYAQAAADIEGRVHQTADVATARFLAWLAEPHGKTWLIVLDDLADPTHLDGLWPPNVQWGRTVVTTRRTDAVLDGDGRTSADVGLFSQEEAAAYLHNRLGEDSDATALAQDLGCLPLALGQAAAYVLDRGLTCARYRERFTERQRSLEDLLPEDARPDGYARAVSTTWSLSIEAADALPPRGLAGKVLELASVLDPNGIPAELFSQQAALEHYGPDECYFANEAEDALQNLRRFNLIGIGSGTVTVHALLQRVIREQREQATLLAIHEAAGEALSEAWPSSTVDLASGQRLRNNFEALRSASEDGLLLPRVHLLVFLAGRSLGESGQAHAAVDYFASAYETCKSSLGKDNIYTLYVQSNLAHWLGVIGDAHRALRLTKGLIADLRLIYGIDHPTVALARKDLALLLRDLSKPAQAFHRLRRVLPDIERHFGSQHKLALDTRRSIADLAGETGQPAEAIQELEALLNLSISALGPEHPGTLTVRGSLIYWQGAAGAHTEAVRAFLELRAVRSRVLGPDHPDTLQTSHNLAGAIGEAGNPYKAVEIFEELVPDLVRILGPDHPETINSAAGLDYWRARAAEQSP